MKVTFSITRENIIQWKQVIETIEKNKEGTTAAITTEISKLIVMPEGEGADQFAVKVINRELMIQKLAADGVNTLAVMPRAQNAITIL